MANPWSIQYELVEGCNLRCWFCGIHAIRGRDNDFKFMTLDMIHDTSREINTWLGKVRVEINNHGEPSVHPNFFSAIDTIKVRAPRTQVQTQTNGYAFFPPTGDLVPAVLDYFNSGGNLLVLNCYKKGQYAYAKEELRRFELDYPSIKVVDFYHDNPDNLSAYRYYSKSAKMVFLFDDLGVANTSGAANKRLAKKILNEAGNSPATALKSKLGIDSVKDPLKKGCSRVFRELTIGWDGTIPVCCYDWKNELVLGKFPQQSLRDIWESRRWSAARVLLHPKVSERHIAPCNVCDYNGGFRLGLLDDLDRSITVDDAYGIVRDPFEY